MCLNFKKSEHSQKARASWCVRLEGVHQNTFSRLIDASHILGQGVYMPQECAKHISDSSAILCFT